MAAPLPVRGFGYHGKEDPWADATPGELELALAIEYERRQTDIVRAELEALRALVERIWAILDPLQITITGDVVTTQPEPTAPGPTEPGSP